MSGPKPGQNPTKKVDQMSAEQLNQLRTLREECVSRLVDESGQPLNRIVKPFGRTQISYCLQNLGRRRLAVMSTIKDQPMGERISQRFTRGKEPYLVILDGIGANTSSHTFRLTSELLKTDKINSVRFLVRTVAVGENQEFKSENDILAVFEAIPTPIKTILDADQTVTHELEVRFRD